MDSEQSFSRVRAKPNCAGKGFTHDFTFSGVPQQKTPVAFVICIGQKSGETKLTRISGYDDCDTEGFGLVGRYPVLPADSASPGRRLCIEQTGVGDIIREVCVGTPKLTFKLPQRGVPKQAQEGSFDHPEGHKRVVLCEMTDGSFGNGDACAQSAPKQRFEMPSLADIAASIAGAKDEQPLFTVVEEEIPCFGFICETLPTRVFRDLT